MQPNFNHLNQTKYQIFVTIFLKSLSTSIKQYILLKLNIIQINLFVQEVFRILLKQNFKLSLVNKYCMLARKFIKNFIIETK